MNLASDGFLFSVVLVCGALLVSMGVGRRKRAQVLSGAHLWERWLHHVVLLFVCLGMMQFDLVVKAHFLANQTNDSNYLMSTISNITPLRFDHHSTEARDIWVLRKDKSATFVRFPPLKQRYKKSSLSFRSSVSHKKPARPLVSIIPDASFSLLNLLNVINKHTPSVPKRLRIVGQVHPAIMRPTQLPYFPPSIRMFRGLLTKTYFSDVIISVQPQPLSLKRWGAVLLLSGDKHKSPWVVRQHPQAPLLPPHKVGRFISSDDCRKFDTTLKQLFRHQKSHSLSEIKPLPIVIPRRLQQSLSVQEVIPLLLQIARCARAFGGHFREALISGQVAKEP